VTPVDRVLLLDKVPGPTSHDVVDQVRRVLRQRTIGHAGTLDPLASGLLFVLAGRATKISGLLSDLDKTYRARLRLGTATDSGDAEGRVTEEAPLPSDLASRLPAVCAQFLGEQAQIPPMASAIKVGGEPLHRLRRAGREVARAPRRIVVHAIEVLSIALPDVELEIRASKGTYVRTLGEDMARALGTVGHLAALRREAIGGFAVTSAVQSDTLLDMSREELLDRAGISLGAALAHLPPIRISAEAARGVAYGRTPRLQDLAPLARPLAAGELARLESPDGEVLAVVEAAAAIAAGRVAPDAIAAANAADRSGVSGLAPLRFRRVLRLAGTPDPGQDARAAEVRG
jgi:tRNA pseudouridine55 synthase